MEVVILSCVDTLRAYYTDDKTQACMSFDGITPSEDATFAQAKKCIVCPQNQWGSRITPNGKRAKACGEFAYLELLALDEGYYKYQMRVPPTSLRAIRDYRTSLTSRGHSLKSVITNVRTHSKETHDLLSFKVVRFLEDGELENLIELSSFVSSGFEPTDGYIH